MHTIKSIFDSTIITYRINYCEVYEFSPNIIYVLLLKLKFVVLKTL